ncbi:MAG: hypothetical protein E3K36_07610 [Candidatus Brocadia sp.]|nr:hypothetical protein [Candidatus Brocadia sp.]
MMDFTEIEKDFIKKKLISDFDWTRFGLPTEPIPLEKPIDERKVIGSLQYFPTETGKYKDSLTAEDDENIFAVRLFCFVGINLDCYLSLLL